MITIAGSIACFTGYFLFAFLPLAIKYKWQVVQGCLLNGLILCLGMVITWQKDPRNSNDWYGHIYHDSDLVVVRINEPLIEKAKSYKANGLVEAIIRDKKEIACTGNILLYFSKDTAVKTKQELGNLQYGDRLIIHRQLQRIRNSGNPGAFNYERYAAFQQVFHHTFLKEKDWVTTAGKKPNRFKQFLFAAREHILSVLRRHMGEGKDECGIAEALLIGYTNDLDKDLVQAYSNTGVVHIIAISGMHLGLIYILLVNLLAKIPLLNRNKFLQALMILVCLWLFSLLTGASASVLRAAVMFSFITIGANLDKRSSIYNSLAAAAFVLLCYNPYFLWDVGFQLSFLAVVSIIVFQQPIYQSWYIKNKWLDQIWKLAAISLAAQILTFPICIYYFHQFPNFFLLANIVAVPLSSLILYAEIGLIVFFRVPFAGYWLGKLVGLLVKIMNEFVLWVNRLPFAVWDGIAATEASTWLLYAIIFSASAWLLKKQLSMLRVTLAFACLFFMLQAWYNWRVAGQQKLVVYNVPRQRAMDLVQGTHFKFIGDSILLQDGVLQNFHLKPARIAQRLSINTDSLQPVFYQNNFCQFYNKRILLLNKRPLFEVTSTKTGLDFIIISNNPSLRMAELAEVFDCGLYIFDASNSLWKIDKWKKECEELHLRSYSVPEKGAFVADVKQ